LFSAQVSAFGVLFFLVKSNFDRNVQN
jgi:hypothetical protein